MEKRKRFKLVSGSFQNIKLYDELDGGDRPFVSRNWTVLDEATHAPENWQEVFEEVLTFPRTMLCGDTKDESTWTKERVVYIEIELDSEYPINTFDGDEPRVWRFAKELPPVIKMTMKEVCEMAGCEVEIIKE